jgi:hypothetical protein
VSIYFVFSAHNDDFDSPSSFLIYSDVVVNHGGNNDKDHGGDGGGFDG